MRTTIRLVALAGVVALAAFAIASLPAFAIDDVSRTAPRLNGVHEGGGGILTLDRNYDNDRPTPQPIVPPGDKEPKPGRVNGSPNGAYASGEGGLGGAVLGGGSAVSSKIDRLERSLRATADRLR